MSDCIDTGNYHVPDHQWNCAACAEAWPCATTRDDLTRELGATPAAIEQTMRAFLLDALAARPDLPHEDLADRHLSWINPRFRTR